MEKNLNISLDKTTEITCLDCGNNTFIEGTMLRKVSRFLVGSSQDGLLPIIVMICSKCHSVLKETLPVQLKEDVKEN